jgi:hypothetical protein
MNTIGPVFHQAGELPLSFLDPFGKARFGLGQVGLGRKASRIRLRDKSRNNLVEVFFGQFLRWLVVIGISRHSAKYLFLRKQSQVFLVFKLPSISL